MHQNPFRYFLLIFCVMILGKLNANVQSDTLKVQGLNESVEIITDKWGIAHIYAQNEHDLFFTQGYNTARDRLFQFEIWRRRATGTVSEILGARTLKQDIGARLFQFRGDMKQELNQYHPHGEAIINAFVDGINAYIDQTRRNPDLLPIEFKLLGIKPQKWTPSVVISRHQGLLYNANHELAYGRAVHLLGAEKVKDLANFHPGEPDISLDSHIDGALLSANILELYNAYRSSLQFQKEDLALDYRNKDTNIIELANDISNRTYESNNWLNPDLGSNNWVISGDLTQSGYPIMANDPHRVITVPSLRYWVHLNAPGWNVIGGGEPTIPGVSIGHNEYGAWGLTVFYTDSEDIYVYEANSDNPNQYKYLGQWEDMRVVQESIAVKGQSPVDVSLKYTRHGPVIFEDDANNKAYALRAGWLEIGGAPYLASLRMDQAKTWEEFREACSYSNLPGENMVWADRNGTIGWQVVGIAPIRKNWSGLVPVPGDGRYEWDGYMPIKARPHVVNPDNGFWATANSNLIKPDYPFRNATGWNWADPFRTQRLIEVLGSGRRHSIGDMVQLQTDYLSIPARTLVPLLENLHSNNRQTERAREILLNWDYRLEKGTVGAGIYVAWERSLLKNVHELLVPPKARGLLTPRTRVRMSKIIDWLIIPRIEFGEDPIRGRDSLLIRSLDDAVKNLTEQLGKNMDNWYYGQLKYKHVFIEHPLSRLVESNLRNQLDIGPLPRGGNSFTVGQTGFGNNQTSGASFKIIVDTQNWDKAIGMNTPGQSGDPANPHYRDLFEHWAQDKYFPVYFSRSKIEVAADFTIVLNAPKREQIQQR